MPNVGVKGQILIGNHSQIPDVLTTVLSNQTFHQPIRKLMSQVFWAHIKNLGFIGTA